MVSKRKGRARHPLEKGSLKKLRGCRQERLKEVRGKWSSNAEIKLKLRQLSAALFTHHKCSDVTKKFHRILSSHIPSLEF